MSRDNTASDRKARIVALSAMVLAVVGALSSFDTANGEPESRTGVAEPNVIATSCSGFAADAHQLFDKRGTVALRGAFAPGDHVHLAIDLRGAGYAWELAGALGAEARVTPSFWYSLFRTTKWTNHTTTTWSPEHKLLSTAYQGETNGYARWDVELDVALAGDGALTINQTGTVPTPPRVVIASCTPRKGAADASRS